MKKLATSLIVLFSSSAWAQGGDASNVSIHDLNKALEICQSLDHKNLKLNCAAAAKECAGSSDKKTCMEKLSK